MHNTSIHPLIWRVKLEKREGRSCIIWFWEFSPTIHPGSFFSDFAIGANAFASNHFPALPSAACGYKKEQSVAGLLFILSEEGKAGGAHKPTRKWAPLLLFRKARKRDQATKLSIAKYSIVKTVEMIPRVVIFSTVKMVAVLFILVGWESVAWWRGEIIAQTITTATNFCDFLWNLSINIENMAETMQKLKNGCSFSQCCEERLAGIRA